MTAKDRTWANNQLRHCRNSAILTMASLRLIKNGALHVIGGETIVINPDGIVFGAGPSDRQGRRFEVELAQLVDEHANHHERLTESLLEWWKFVRRNLCKESFEVTKAYANANGAMAALQKQPWYAYARALRKAISHDFHFGFTNKDLARLPVTWAGKTIDGSMEGKDMTGDLLDPYTA